jgi:hypothetical protein
MQRLNRGKGVAVCRDFVKRLAVWVFGVSIHAECWRIVGHNAGEPLIIERATLVREIEQWCVNDGVQGAAVVGEWFNNCAWCLASLSVFRKQLSARVRGVGDGCGHTDPQFARCINPQVTCRTVAPVHAQPCSRWSASIVVVADLEKGSIATAAIGGA